MIGPLEMEHLGKFLWGISELKLAPFKEEEGKRRGETAASKKKTLGKHVEVINDLLICVPNTKVIY